MAHVLVIDDSGYFRSASRLALCKAGHTVSFASDGVSGAEMLEMEQFDVLMIGVALPVADGAEVLSRLRSRGVNTPAIGVGAGVSPATKSKFSSLGVIDVIERFVEPSQVVMAVNRAIAHTTAQAA